MLPTCEDAGYDGAYGKDVGIRCCLPWDLRTRGFGSFDKKVELALAGLIRFVADMSLLAVF